MNRLLTLLLLIGAAVGVLAVLGPTTGWYRTTTVLSGSMQPTINPGDVIVVVPTGSDNVRPGDIVTFQLPDGNGTVTHRVTSVERRDGKLNVNTKGDANEAADTQAVTFVDDTAWRTKLVIPKVGYALVAVRAILEQRLYPAVIGLLIAASLLWTIWRPSPKEAHVSAG